jgi:hypothetical protein
MKLIFNSTLLVWLLILAAPFCKVTIAQTDSTKVEQTDSTEQVTAVEQQTSDTETEHEFIFYAGGSLNSLYISDSDSTQASGAAGYQFGINYKRGGFFYWQVGLGYYDSYYDLTILNDTATVSVQNIYVPLTGGINILSATDAIIGLRAFLSLVPAFVIGVGDNDLVQKDDLNSFILYGQVGIGINIIFLSIDIGYNYGFQSLLKDVTSNPGQGFVNLGFRY